MAIGRIYKQPTSPKLFDAVIQDLVQLKDGIRKYSPNVYQGKGEYVSLLPDNTKLENYCFFVMEDPQVVGMQMQAQNRVKSPFSLIVWVDMRKVGASYDDRNTELLKEDVLKVVRTAWLKKGSVTLERIYERAENVFQGFSLNEVDNQFLMSPYWGMRITGEMVVNEDCVTT